MIQIPVAILDVDVKVGAKIVPPQLARMPVICVSITTVINVQITSRELAACVMVQE